MALGLFRTPTSSGNLADQVAEHSSADLRGTLGRYALYGEIAAGGMATVHIARLLGPVGFARTVAIKRLHPHLAKDPTFVAMFLDEARLAARVRHPNVVATLDVVDEDGELLLVMEYVPGESLSRLVRRSRKAGKRILPKYVSAVVCAALEGLQAAHEATSERSAPLGIVHRDVSPQNIHVGLDGVARVLDFGIAKATSRVQETRTDQIKGKIAYMSPEQLAKGPIDRRADVYSASVVLWEALTGARLFEADDVPSLVYAMMNEAIRPPSVVAPNLPKGLDEIVMKGLERAPARRWSSAREMAIALEKVLPPAPAREIGAWVRETAGETLARRIELVHRIESESSISIPPPMRLHSPQSMQVRDSGIVRALSPTRHGVAAADPEDDRATLYRPAPNLSSSKDGERPSRRPLVFVAIGLVLAAAGLLGFALLELRRPSETATATVEAADEAEAAIGLGATRPGPNVPSATGTSKRIESSDAPASTTKPSSLLAPAPVNECDDPFTIDAKGMRHPKPHCFKR